MLKESTYSCDDSWHVSETHMSTVCMYVCMYVCTRRECHDRFALLLLLGTSGSKQSSQVFNGFSENKQWRIPGGERVHKHGAHFALVLSEAHDLRNTYIHMCVHTYTYVCMYVDR